MSGKRELTQDTLDELLSWLNPNREEAARKYKTIHDGLVTMLSHRGCTEAEELADETINIVATKVPVIRRDYKGNPASYFYGVAKKLLLAYQRKPRVTPLIDEWHTIPNPEPTDELAFICLQSCMERLTPEQRKLVGLYYKDDSSEQRKGLARRLGTNVTNLRVRVHRIVLDLRECIDKCIQREGP